jgi:prepilin-type processing-associated H-X9-DG protein
LTAIDAYHTALGFQWLAIAVVPALAIAPALVVARRERLALGASGRGLIRTLVCLEAVFGTVALIGIASIVTVPLMSAKMKAQDIRCSDNVKALGQALLLYSQDWDEKLPPASGWYNGARQHLTKDAPEDVFQCPASISTYGYALNSAIGGLPLGKVTAPMITVGLFESSSNRANDAGGVQLVTREPRHSGGLWFAYLDGHVGFCLKRKGWTRLGWSPKQSD